MFVLTVDQIGSRRGVDRVADVLAELSRDLRGRTVRGPTRTVGDEFQVLLSDASATLDLVLRLDRTGTWNLGCGIGPVETPVPRDVRAARGPAFVAAREAVDAAKKRTPRFALRVAAGAPLTSADVEPLVDLLLAVRGRRTAAGWALADLVAGGLTQAEAATRLGITAQAASQRARAAQVRAEADARPALVRLLAEADGAGTRA